jgi:hypothetical protein
MGVSTLGLERSGLRMRRKSDGHPPRFAGSARLAVSLGVSWLLLFCGALAAGELPATLRTALAAGEPQDVLVLLASERASRAAAEITREEGLSYEGPRALRRKAELYAETKRELVAALGAEAPEILLDYSELPILFVRVRSLDALERLTARPEVVAVGENRRIPLASTSSDPVDGLNLIRQPQVAAQGVVGTGTVVAVLDTRVDTSNPNFPTCTAQGSAQSCVVASPPDFSGNPEPDTSHGTNVAAIILAVAPDTRIAALSVVGAGCDGASDSALIAAVNWCIQQKRTGLNLVAMNLSLGTQDGFSAPCPNHDLMITAVIANAKAANILTVISAGNSGQAGEIAWPACIPGVVSVGAVYDAKHCDWGLASFLCDQGWCVQQQCTDGVSRCVGSCNDRGTIVPDQIACFSNRAPFLTLFAPGVFITAAGIPESGTSQAAPFVAGAAAVLRAEFPGESVDQTVFRMTSTGFPIVVADQSPFYVIPRLDLWTASSALSQTVTVTLAAQPQSGAAPLATSLTATVSGSASGTINYTFWWDCDDPGVSVAAVMTACGAIPEPPSGSCATSTAGIKCNAVTDNPKIVSHTYSATHLFRPKVIAERGVGTPAEKRTFVSVTQAPVVTTAPASSLTGSAAVLNGSVNPESAPTQAWFEWGTRSDLASPTQTPPQSLATGSASQAISAPLAGLNPNTTYYFRAAASNAGGTVRGQVTSFATLAGAVAPAVTTLAASAVTPSSATIGGSVNPNGSDTTVSFEWGTSPALSGANVTLPQDIGAGTAAVPVSFPLAGLGPAMGYFFRAVATSGAGTVRGTTLSFTTQSAAQSELIGNGGFELGTSPWSVAGNFQIASGFPYPHSGSAYAFLTLPGGTPGNNLFGTLDQSVTLPGGVSSALLSFWVNVSSQDSTSTPYDFFDVTVEDASGGYLATVAVLSNLDQQPAGLYRQVTYDMTRFAGTTVRVHFLATTDASLPTVFRIDDVSLTVTANAPAVTTGTASAIGALSATLNGTVKSQGSPASAWFEWGTDGALGSFAVTPPQGVGASSSAQGFAQALGQLSPATTYFFRAAASNPMGTARGPIASFSTSAGATSPVAGSLPATGLTSSGAVLNGSVLAGTSSASYWFEWGTDPALNAFFATPAQSLGPGSAPIAVSAALGGLGASTTYYFRAVASNAAGTARAAILGFTTPAAPAPVRVLNVASADTPGGVTVAVSPSDRNGAGNGTTPFDRLYDSGTQVTLTAPPTVAGQNFLQWTANGAALTSSTTATVTMNADYNLTATYGAAPGVQLLAVGLNNPNAVAVDATSVYWLENGGGLFRKAAKDGSGAVTLAAGIAAPSGLALDGGYAYLGENLGASQCRLRRVTLDGSGASTVATDSASVSRLAVDGSNLYWTDINGGTVRAVPKAGGAVTILATGSSTPAGVATDGTNVYWTEFTNPGRVEMVPVGGGTTSGLATGTNTPGIATDGTRVYWTQSTLIDGGQLNTIPVAGGVITPLATGLSYPWDIALDGVNAYWIENFSSGNVKQVPIGGGSVIPLASGLSSPTAIATDATYVYWVERGDGGPSSGTLKRVAKSLCSYAFTPTSVSLPAAGGGGNVAITAPDGCAWTTASNAGWITITAGTTGSGNGTLSYAVAPNSGVSPRVGTISIQGQLFAVNQAGTVSTATRWARLYGGGAQGDVARAVAPTADGGFVLAGLTGFGAGGGDAMVVRLDSAGNLVWAKTFGGAGGEVANAVALTSDGGFVVAGSTTSFGAGGSDGWLFKLNANGNVVWQRTYGGSASDYLTDVEVLADGGFIAAGFTSSFGAGQGDLWLLRLDSAGNVVWQKTYGGSGTEDLYNPGRNVRPTADGGFVAVASSTSFRAGNWDAWVLKLDASGNVLWQNTYATASSGFANAVAPANDGGFLVAGIQYGTNPSGWVFKLDATGALQWERTWNDGSDDTEARSVATTADGGAVIGGVSHGDAWMAKLDAAGSVEWSKTYGGTSTDGANSVAEVAGGGYVVAGWSQSFGTTWYEFWALRLDVSGSVSPSCNLGVGSGATLGSPTAAAASTVVTSAATSVTPAATSAVTGVPAIQVAEQCAACENPPAAIVTGTQSICSGASALVSAALTGTAPWTVTWSDGTTQSGVTASPVTHAVSPTMTTTYTVTTVTDAQCNGTSSGSAQITIVPAAPAPVLGNNGPLCAGATLQLTAPAASGGTYSWTGPGGFTSTQQNPVVSSATPAASGTYNATVTVNGCPSLPGATAVTVNAVPAAPTAGSNSPVCAGVPVQLTAATVPGASYAWTGPGGFIAVGQKVTVPGATASAAGIYSVTTTVNGCTSPPASTQVAVLATPLAVVSGGGTFCAGGSTTLQASLQGTPPWTLTWSDGFVQSGILASPAVRTVSPTALTTYAVSALSDASCPGTASGTATADPSCEGFFFTVPPCRLIDTRNAPGPYGGPTLNAGQQRQITVSGQCGIPASARALVMNVTVVHPTTAGFLTLFPGGTAHPQTSTLNYVGGQVRANNAVVMLGTGGTLAVYEGQASGGADFVIDVNGYFE